MDITEIIQKKMRERNISTCNQIERLQYIVSQNSFT